MNKHAAHPKRPDVIHAHKISYHRNGRIHTQTWELNEKLHREDGAAVIMYTPDGDAENEEWYLNGVKIFKEVIDNNCSDGWHKSKHTEVHLQNKKLHCQDGAALIKYNTDGSVDCEEWYLNGKLSRQDAPAHIEYYADGCVKREKWYENGVLSRIKGPADLEYYHDGTLKVEKWYDNNQLHRWYGPANIEYNDDGSEHLEEWWWRDLLHREDGPAYTLFSDDEVEEERWYVHGHEVYEEDLDKYV